MAAITYSTGQMAKKLNKDFDKKGICTLSVDGKSNFFIPLKLVIGLEIPFNDL